MTEQQIETLVEARMERLDYRLIVKNTITQDEYDAEVDELNHWADKLYEKLEAAR